MRLDYSDLIGGEFERDGRGERMDCVGLMVEIHRRLGNEIYDPLEVCRGGQTVTDEDLDRCGRQFEACTRPYEVGDVFLMATGRLGNGDVDHVAVYVGHGRVIQTTERLGVITTEVRAVERMTRMVMRFRQDAVLAG